ncbi:hypothetical protein Ami103574_08325 [Aminipila butyrica]|uniref:Nif11 domain-containing protein n=1 Tax=Aminipila butyrica TaxID=433296 RepID=A0A858BVX3_9FIRM|nr:hypothetical protein [Aminipila butyrica]QIB69329.1 hypothetical protein Ami103574_08325 [Aminipila butyrica]
MTRKEFYEKLDADQKKLLNTFKTAEDVISFAQELGISLEVQVAQEIAGELPDELLEAVSGGTSTRAAAQKDLYQ